MVHFTVTIQVDNIVLARDYFEFWIPCTKELFTVYEKGIVYGNKEDSSPVVIAYTQITLNVHLQGCDSYTGVLSIPPSHFNRYPVCIGCRRLDGPSQRIMSEVYITAQQLRSSNGAILFGDGTNAQLLIDSPQFNLMTQPSVDVKPPESIDIGTYYQGQVITDEWLQETYIDILHTLGRMATVSEEVKQHEFQELLMIVCSETLTRGEYVNETDPCFHGFSNGLSPCVQSQMECAIGVYQIYMSVYFGEFTSPGSKRMQLVAHELGYPMLTQDGHRLIFHNTEEDHGDYFFNIPYHLANSPDVLDCFHVFSVSMLFQDTETHEFPVYCHARSLISSRQRDTADACLVYNYTFTGLVPKHKSIDSKQLCFIRPIIPLEYGYKPVSQEKNFFITYLEYHYRSELKTIFVPCLPDNLNPAFVTVYGHGFFIQYQ